MAQDIRELFKDGKITHEKMPENHQERFINKLDEALPVSPKSNFGWMRIAASIVLLVGLSFGGYKILNPKVVIGSEEVANNETTDTKTLGDVSPGLKEVEDYYLASINLELSKIKYTAETKDLFDGYIEQLSELDKEYKRLSLELTESGPSELTVNALIDNLKLRLNLLYRLKSQLKELTPAEAGTEEVEQSI
ncbi:hypothetical protein [Seonamhaeicola maritimus]|uniref:DUF4179 domain-containing protein n=1 Tax=Seonamhaeicola maritimus TaxID=2591822 RepID=A0A5C7GKS1_9FLAO|nr:hypothetical protein [Seonamhaeicola maritimus]TXG38948.1 hypothetical protein FUA22_03400 [Seonamhaeicola maritimus]